MAKYSVLVTVNIELEVDTLTSKYAAFAARDRTLGLLHKVPPEVKSVGFMPDHEWQVREVLENGRRGPVIHRGKDKDLVPRGDLD